MTVPAPPLLPAERPEDRPNPVHWRHGLLALLPLVLAGYWPLWVCALLGALTWLGLRLPAWASGRLILFLLVVGVSSVLGVLGALGSGPERLVSVGVGYLVSLFLAALLHLGLSMLEGGSRWGVLLVLVPGLLAPQPWLVLGVVGGLLGRPGPDDRSPPSRTPPQRPVWAVVGGLSLAVLLGGLLLPRGEMNFGALVPAQGGAPAQRGSAVPQEAAPQEIGGAGPPESASQAGSGRTGLRVRAGAGTDRLFSVLLSLSLLLGLVLSLLLYRRMAFGRAPVPLSERLIALGLILTFILTFLAAVLMQFTRSSSEGDAAPLGGLSWIAGLGRGSSGEGGREVDLTALSSFISVMLMLGLLALIALALLALRAREAEERRGGEAPGLAPLALASPQAPAVHRVRLAYRAAEEVLLGAGYARRLNETPTGYAARLASAFPQLAAPLWTLTRAYAPVRYGDDVSERGAESAEAAARELAALAPRLPSPAEPGDDPTERTSP